MAFKKTKTVSVTTSDDIVIKASRDKIIATVEEPEVNEMLSSMDKDDILTWVRSEGFTPAEVFSVDDLQRWAEDNGFVKE